VAALALQTEIHQRELLATIRYLTLLHRLAVAAVHLNHNKPVVAAQVVVQVTTIQH
jgi:hypothetical protein